MSVNRRELNDHTVIINEETVPFLAFNSLKDIEWLRCGFSTRLGGVSKGCCSTMNMSFSRGDNPDDVHENIRRFSKSAGFLPEQIVMPHQCHTTNVRVVGKDECGCGVFKPGCTEEIDGQITAEKNVVLYCMGADCVPVFMVDINKKIIAASHAGWKGTINDIVCSTIKRMKSEFGSDVEDIKAVIGPSICMECYEVSADVAVPFIEKYSGNNGNADNVVRPAGKENEDRDKYYLNLWEANRINLINAGVDPKNIEISGYCTKCHPDMLFSHRFHGDNRGVNIGFIFMA
ncbi:MAG: peptidoglycan editing factor PgeF [Lachnospiraceae bacterium]|nr:peptidoglycan editing factor PgeF [Lachnospiraceae bacterium]